MTSQLGIAARLGFVAGMATGIEMAIEGMRDTFRTIDEETVARAFNQLAEDWALLFDERMDAGEDWSDVLDDLQMMRLKGCLERVRGVFKDAIHDSRS